eukprot:6651728-Pyramimonas_sp.AAC.1
MVKLSSIRMFQPFQNSTKALVWGRLFGPLHGPPGPCVSTVSGPTVVPSIEDQARLHARAQAWRAQAWLCRPRGALPAVHPPGYRILQWRTEERGRISD